RSSPGVVVISACTSHMACARKVKSKSPARNCGRPKRSRVKYGRIRSSRVFYHVGGFWRKCRAMSDVEINPCPAPPPAPQFAAATQPTYVRTLFLGPDGLRPGWGFVFYAVIFYALQRLAVELAWARDLGAGGLWSSMLEEFGDLAAAVIPALVLA